MSARVSELRRERHRDLTLTVAMISFARNRWKFRSGLTP